MEGINRLLGKLPIVPATLLFLAYLYASYQYLWLKADDSEFAVKTSALAAAKEDLVKVKAKVTEGEEFYRNLDAIRTRIIALTKQLDGTKTSLSGDIDIANFVRMVTLEAKRLSFAIKGIKPDTEVKKEYYVEVPFTVTFRGAYVQILVFFDRIAKFQQVIRISDFEMKPSGNAFTKYVELEGSAKLVAYKYLGTAADNILNKDSMKSSALAPGTTAPQTPAQTKPGAQGGG